jgi:hypothetical protein
VIAAYIGALSSLTRNKHLVVIFGLGFTLNLTFYLNLAGTASAFTS